MDKNDRRKMLKVALVRGEAVAITMLRLAAWTNGYTPTPNRDKRTLRPAWNSQEPDEVEIRSWLHPRAGVTFHPATGLMIVDGLATVDCDFPDHDIAQAARLIIRQIAPQLFEGALERGRDDGSPKFMLFCRRADGAEPFTVQSKKWSESAGGRTDTPTYIRAMYQFLQGTGFAFLNKDDRAAAVRMLPYWDEIDAWRSTLPKPRQQALNNPREVERAYRTAT